MPRGRSAGAVISQELRFSYFRPQARLSSDCRNVGDPTENTWIFHPLVKEKSNGTLICATHLLLYLQDTL